MTDIRSVGGASRPAIGRRQLVDIGERARYWTYQIASDAAAIAGARLAAGWDLIHGHPEAALLRYGRTIRHVQMARESLSTYALIEHLIRRHPAELSAYRAEPIRPERFLFFVGYSRSGHSLIAALLDAHPDILVAHELHAVKHLERGADFADVAKAIQHNSRFFEYFGRGYSGYRYDVATQYQGRSSRPRIIGDKKANGTSRILRRDLAVVDRLREHLPVPFTFVHVVRNPFDNIASRARRTNTSLDWAARSYVANATLIDQLNRRWPDSIIHVYLEDLVADPKRTLVKLLEELGIQDIDERYLCDCARIVFREPAQPRYEVNWPPELRQSVESLLGDCSFLQRFADEP
jgi:Sulfotransferase family